MVHTAPETSPHEIQLPLGLVEFEALDCPRVLVTQGLSKYQSHLVSSLPCAAGAEARII